MNDRQFYTVKEFCRRNSIGKTLFYELVNAGVISTAKLGRKTLVPAASEQTLHEWIAQRSLPTIQPTTQVRIAANHGERKRSKNLSNGL